jgi:hypothetical protein
MEDVKPMNKGVLILLERMSSNPDEFVPDVTGLYPPKWRSTILSVTMRMKGGKDYDDQLSFLSDEEIKALWHKMQELQGELFTKKVMNTLLQESFTEELSSSFAQTKNASCTISLSGLQNTGAVSGTITGKLRYP